MPQTFQGKKILIAVPNHFGLPDIFKKNLEFLGFEVFILSGAEGKQKISKKDTLIHGIRKFIFKDKTYKQKIKNSINEKIQLDYLSTLPIMDYALFIRPDLYSTSIVNRVKSISQKVVAYQWDGISRYPLVKEYIHLFDAFFVFDENDSLNYPSTIKTNNFYFDFLPDTIQKLQDVFFIGTYMEDRIAEIVNLTKLLTDFGLKTNINIVCKNKKKVLKYKDSPVHFISQGISFEQSIRNSKSSDIILDVENSIHRGISFRPFEAIGYGKKLITNNSLVKNYDFYHPNNIYVIENRSYEGLEDFLYKPFETLPSEIREKYSFTSWLQNILSTSPF